MDVTQVLESTLSPGMFFYFIFYIILFFLSFFLFLAIFLIYSSIVTLADRMFFPLVLQMRRHVPTPNNSSSTLPRPTLYVLLLLDIMIPVDYGMERLVLISPRLAISPPSAKNWQTKPLNPILEPPQVLP